MGFVFAGAVVQWSVNGTAPTCIVSDLQEESTATNMQIVRPMHPDRQRVASLHSNALHIPQIEAEALRKLRHSALGRGLRAFLEE
jgi:hypothetical protein